MEIYENLSTNFKLSHHSIEIKELPKFTIDILGFPNPLRGITVVITNIGEGEAIDVEWTVDIQGGLFVNPSDDSGTIETLAPGESQEISVKVFGFGLGFLAPMPEITVTTSDVSPQDPVEKTEKAKIIGCFVLI